jgi:uncharacterized membrane-anchored protein YitT (DUF2179 family)
MEQNWKQTVKTYALITLGACITAAGVYLFKYPNNFSTGGVSGLSVILHALFPNITAADFASVINIVFLLLGFLVLGRGTGLHTVFGTLVFSGALQLLQLVFPMTEPLTDQPLLELFFAVILPAFGSAILFNVGASTGGTDIIAMILKKLTNMDIGRALLCSDVLIAASTLFLFDVRTGLYSLLGLLLKSALVDSVIESLNRKKAVTVVTDEPEKVATFIRETLNRSSTSWDGEGDFTHQRRRVLITALSRGQAVMLRHYVYSVDPHAFIMISNSSEIFGKGFLRA